MTPTAGSSNAHTDRLVRWHGLAWLAPLLALALPTITSAQLVVPAARPPLPGTAAPVPSAKKPSQSGPQPIPESLLRSAIVPPPAQTFVPSAPAGVPITAAPPTVPISTAFEETTHDYTVISGSLEEKHLLPLLLREQELLKRYGNDHPEVQAVRARIHVVKDWISRQPAPIVRSEAVPAPIHDSPIVQVGHTATSSPVEAAQPHPPTPPESKQAPTAAAAPPPVVERVIEVRQLPVEEQSSSSTKMIVQLVSILAAVAVILMVQLVALVVVLRRYAARLTPQVRVELVNSTSGQSAPIPAEVVSQRIYVDSSEPPRREFPPPMSEMPSYEEVRQSEEEAAQKQDEAVFRQVFEDNLRLREQIAAQ